MHITPEQLAAAVVGLVKKTLDAPLGRIAALEFRAEQQRQTIERLEQRLVDAEATLSARMPATEDA